MKQRIGIVGLGLIGASFAKAIRKTDVVLYGVDTNPATLRFALDEKTVDFELTRENLPQIDVLFLALYPNGIFEYVRENAQFLRQGAIICDFCGVKQEIAAVLAPICAQNRLVYIGGHPMAGKERWGYAYADETLFEHASMLLTPDSSANDVQIETVANICESAGFSRVICTTPEEHDAIIAYTSQLAHVVSGAYMKSKTAEKHDGFSAGSYRDLTRVAKLNETMWTELFLYNRTNLIREIDSVIHHLEEYRKALEEKNEPCLKELIREARERKEALG
ncbi:MAG: prephenate dehydrogenase [Oscillospiraceae bacterium]|nr:prephenate dehydrogenase [Oscillospiraceae bacterium]